MPVNGWCNGSIYGRNDLACRHRNDTKSGKFLMPIEQLTSFFAWCTLLNFAFLLFATLCLMVMRNFIMSTHSKMFGVKESDLPNIYFKYLAYYKIATIVFSLVPYLALRIIS